MMATTIGGTRAEESGCGKKSKIEKKDSKLVALNLPVSLLHTVINAIKPFHVAL
jgi:hypothetical protein